MIVNTELAQSNGHELKDLWATPDKIFLPLDNEFGFTLDPCCLPETSKCKKYYTPLEDGLKQDWAGNIVFCNPPYSRGNIDLWVKKCYTEGMKPNTIVVALLPVSSSSKWWHDYVCESAPLKLQCTELRFVKGRVRFVNAPFTAPFSSAIVVYKLTTTQNNQHGTVPRITLSEAI